MKSWDSQTANTLRYRGLVWGGRDEVGWGLDRVERESDRWDGWSGREGREWQVGMRGWRREQKYA